LGELLPDNEMSAAILMNWVASFLLIQFFLPIYEAISLHGVFLIFTGFRVLGLGVIKCFLKESMGKGKLELLNEYARNNKNRT
jgi:hypothetical protein